MQADAASSSESILRNVSWIRKAADQGDADAQFNLGVMYASGHDVAQDYKTAMWWYRKAADQGYAKAQCNLGSMYYEGHGVPQDYGQAASWYRKAADQGDAEAQCNLGNMYARGRGVPQDYSAAASWYRKAADQGDEEAQQALTRLQYWRGRALPAGLLFLCLIHALRASGRGAMSYATAPAGVCAVERDAWRACAACMRPCMCLEGRWYVQCSRV